jgi:beta-aspartyl-peptidase (threonine type)
MTVRHRKHRPVATLVAAAMLHLVACSPPPAPRVDGAQVQAALETQVAAWNRGDMDAFLATYWPDSDLTFYSGGTVTKGFAPFAERFKARYGQASETMGKLEFRNLEVHPLGPTSAFARGEWHLERAGQEPQGGLFTLILEKKNGGWKIVHDHTGVFETQPEG